ncbi:hypothetical protein SprV_0401421600 [Sparganum proliferum]
MKEWRKEKASLRRLVIDQQSKIISLLEQNHSTREHHSSKKVQAEIQTELFCQRNEEEEEKKKKEICVPSESVIEENCRLEAVRCRLMSTVSTLRQEISRLFEENEELKKRNANLEIELHLNQQAAVKNLCELERSHEAEKRLEEDLLKCRREVDKQQHTIGQLKADLDDEREARDELQKSLERAQLALTEADREMLELQQRHKAKVTHLKAKHDLTSSQLDEAKSELSALDGELCEANDVIGSYKEEILKLESENVRLLEVSQEVQNACEALQFERKTQEERIVHFEERCLRLEEEIEKLRDVNGELSEKVGGGEAEIDRLQGLLATALDANAKVEADMQALEQKFTAEMLRVNSRMVELSELKAIYDEEIEQRKALEVELQEQKKDIEMLGSQVQTKEAQLQELSTQLKETVVERDKWENAHMQNKQNLMTEACRKEEALLQTLQTTKDKCDEEIAALRGRAKELEERLGETNRRHLADSDLKQRLQTEVLKLRNLMKRLQEDRTKSREQFERKMAKLACEADEERASLECEVAQLRDRCKILMSINESLRSDLVEAKKTLINCQDEKVEAEESLRRLSNQLELQVTGSQIKFKSVQEMQKAYLVKQKCWDFSDLEDENKIKERQLEVLRADLKSSEKCCLELKGELREVKGELKELKTERISVSTALGTTKGQFEEIQHGLQPTRFSFVPNDEPAGYGGKFVPDSQQDVPTCKPRRARKGQIVAEVSMKERLRPQSVHRPPRHHCESFLLNIFAIRLLRHYQQ